MPSLTARTQQETALPHTAVSSQFSGSNRRHTPQSHQPAASTASGQARTPSLGTTTEDCLNSSEQGGKRKRHRAIQLLVKFLGNKGRKMQTSRQKGSVVPERAGNVTGKRSEKVLEQKCIRQGPAATLPGTGCTQAHQLSRWIYGGSGRRPNRNHAGDTASLDFLHTTPRMISSILLPCTEPSAAASIKSSKHSTRLALKCLNQQQSEL